jgi:hypothetical protein
MKLASIMRFIVIGLIGLVTVALPKARADESNQKTVVTFSAPVEIPGQVLPAGTYVFKIVDSESDRNIVEVYNKDENHLYGTFLSVPDYRLRPRGKPIVTFEERASGAPEAVKAWIYPGENYGHEFVYPKVRAAQLAKANNQPVASMPDELAANTTPANTTPATTANTTNNASNNNANAMAMKQAPLKAQKPNQEEVDIIEVFPLESRQRASSAGDQSYAPANEQAYNSQPAMPDTLPKTASDLPLIGLMGLLSLAGAGILRYAAAKIR